MGAQRFKRDNGLIEQVEQYIRISNPNADDTAMLNDLVKKYEYATFPEWSDKPKFTADVIDDFVNDFGFADDLVADTMANNHPTLQQSFMRLCLKFIKKMSEKKYCDGRNEASVKTAKKIMEAFGDEPIALPCI
jgi:hypothetical protein